MLRYDPDPETGSELSTSLALPHPLGSSPQRNSWGEIALRSRSQVIHDSDRLFRTGSRFTLLDFPERTFGFVANGKVYLHSFLGVIAKPGFQFEKKISLKKNTDERRQVWNFSEPNRLTRAQLPLLRPDFLGSSGAKTPRLRQTKISTIQPTDVTPPHDPYVPRLVSFSIPRSDQPR